MKHRRDDTMLPPAGSVFDLIGNTLMVRLDSLAAGLPVKDLVGGDLLGGLHRREQP